MSELAAQFKARVAANRAKETEALTGEVEVAGIKFVAKRPPVALWFRSGRVPQCFVLDMLKVSKGELKKPDATQYSPEEQMMLVAFQRHAIFEAFVDPKVVDGEPANDNEISYQDLVETLGPQFDELIKWVMSGCPGVPVATTDGGVTTVDAVAGFREKQPGGTRIDAGEASTDAPASAEPGATT